MGTQNGEPSVAVSALIGPHKIIILVTSAYHMYRAKQLFEKQGMKVIPYKVDYKIGRNKEMVIMDYFPDAESIKLTENGVREIIGRLFYIIKH